MKKTFLTVFAMFFILTQSVNAQNPTSRETIEKINKLLKSNPYTDSFQEITFYYTIDITPENELLVTLEYDGPYKTCAKSKISDLNPVNQNNPAMFPSTYLCWNCKSEANNQCVINEIIYEGGGKDSHTSGNICVMFNNKNNIFQELCDTFAQLFSECSSKK
jgi:hypothetical protein